MSHQVYRKTCLQGENNNIKKKDKERPRTEESLPFIKKSKYRKKIR
jgi:hypothetical protein